MQVRERGIVALMAPRSLSGEILYLFDAGFVFLPVAVLIIDFPHSFSLDAVLPIIFPLGPMALIGFTLLCFSRKNRSRVVVDRSNGVIDIFNKGQSVGNYDVHLVESQNMICKRTAQDYQYRLVLLILDGSSPVLFSDSYPHARAPWEAFSARLAEAIERPLKIEHWREDINGKLTLTPQEERLTEKTKTIWGVPVWAVTIVVSFTGAICYLIGGTITALLLFGATTVSINVGLAFWFATRHRDFSDIWGKGKIALSGFAIVLCIRYTMLYLFIALPLWLVTR